MPEQETADVMSRSQKKSSGKLTQLQVNMLTSGEVTNIMIEKKSTGRELLQNVFSEMGLDEYEYFGLMYEDNHGQTYWLDPEKKVSSQLKTPWVMSLRVKFYPPEPSQLSYDYTRYQLYLQVRQDILSNKLPCSFVTYALLGSYVVQSELGDFDTRLHTESSYLNEFSFSPSSSPELSDKVMELHRTHRGQTPAEAELLFLENAKKLAMYGVNMHEALDQENVDITLGVCASGLLVYKDKLRINRFAWPKILKLSYKRQCFYVKIRPAEYERVESTIGFKLLSHKGAKRLWKTCVEHHTFFRLTEPTSQPSRGRVGLLTRLGSGFRYSGRTQYQSKQRALDAKYHKNPDFTRGQSSRGTYRSCNELRSGGPSPEASKRHTMSHPPPHIPGVDTPLGPPSPSGPSPVPKSKKGRRRGASGSSGSSVSSLEGVFDSSARQAPKPMKRPVGGVAVLPTLPPNSTTSSPSGYATSSPKHAKNGLPSKLASTQLPGKGSRGTQSPKYTSNTRSPLAQSPGSSDLRKAKSPDSPYTRQYSYEELDKEPRRTYSPTSHGFSYEGEHGKEVSPSDVSHGVRKAHAQAFTYAPAGLDQKSSGLGHDKAAPRSGDGDDIAVRTGSAMSRNSPDPQYRKQDIDAGLMPETSVDDGNSVALDTSTDISFEGRPKKDKSNKKPKKSDKKEKKADKRNSGAKEEAKAKNMRKKFGIFGGLLGKNKASPKTEEKPVSDTSSSDSDSDSDDSVIVEAREAAQPQDLDASLAASDVLKHDQSTLLQADVSNRSYAVGDQTLGAGRGDNSAAETTLTSTRADVSSAADTTITGSLDRTNTNGDAGTMSVGSATAGVTRTTTHTATSSRHGEMTERSVKAVEDLATGTLHVNTTHQKKSVEERAHVQATTVTTITEQRTTQPDQTATHQVQEKTFSARTRTDPAGQQEETVTTHHTTKQSRQRQADPVMQAEVSRLAYPAPATLPRSRTISSGSDDSGTSVDPLDEEDRSDVPLTMMGVVPPQDTEDTEIISTQAVSSKTRTVETITYQTECGGLTETRVQKKITIESDGGAPIDHDAALAAAIQEATAMNPDMTVEKIEIEQQTTQ